MGTDDAARRPPAAATPGSDAQRCIVALGVIAAGLLLVAREGIDHRWPAFRDLRLATIWHSLAIAVPLTAALMLNRAAERFTWLAAAALSLLLAPLAWHGGDACSDAEVVTCSPVLWPYGCALGIALFILVPFLQTARDAQAGGTRRLPYGDLYQYAWDNALALAGALLFTGVAWLILWLAAALFKLIGIGFFSALFESQRFAYPVTGLFAGFGLALSRTQRGSLRAVLRLCLSLSRVLLPLIGLLALAFLAALPFTGLAALWSTRHAAALMLALICGVTVLANGVYQDGSIESPYPPPLRRAVSLALLSLPVYAAIAIYALALRVDQHGWSVERLWAALLTGVAGAQALGLAGAALARRGPWLAPLATTNPLIAAGVVTVLLTSQSPLLDFRLISLHSQLARLDSGRLDRAGLDLRYLRFELGRAGIDALRRLRADPRYAGDLATRIDETLAMRNPWSAGERTFAALTAADLTVVPDGTPLPDGLLDAVNAALRADRTYGRQAPCGQPADCVLARIDLDAGGGENWVFVGGEPLPTRLIFAADGARWRPVGRFGLEYGFDSRLAQNLRQGRYQVREPRWRELVIDGKAQPIRAYRETPDTP